MARKRFGPERIAVWAALLTLLTVLAQVPLAAQTLAGRAVDAETGEPLSSAFVVLVTDDGASAARGLTGETGDFAVQAPKAGRYQLRVERFGYEVGEEGPVSLGAETTLSFVVRLQPRPFLLDVIKAEADPRCEVRPETGRLTARLWEEVGKALRVAEWSENEELLRFRVAVWDRELGAERLSVLDESRRDDTRFMATSPFRSRPADELRRFGYVQKKPDGTLSYFAPDAEVLLSDVFLDGHCFTARTEDAPQTGWVGLAFEPLEPSGVADVRGVLWVDGTTSELRRLEYAYTRLPADLKSDRVGGRVDFERLPEGPWFVRRWSIRMPHVGLRAVEGGAEQQPFLMGIKETGGGILEVRLPDGSEVTGQGTATLRGTVFDSTRARPLSNALVWLSGTEFSSTTDSQGRFQLDDLPAGVYEVVFDASRLGELPWAPEPVPVELQPGDRVTVDLTIPPEETVMDEGCQVKLDQGDGIMVGRVTTADDGSPSTEAVVVVSWQSLRQLGVARAHPDRDGLFSVCGLPRERIDIGAYLDGAGGPALQFDLRRGGVHYAELKVPARR